MTHALEKIALSEHTLDLAQLHYPILGEFFQSIFKAIFLDQADESERSLPDLFKYPEILQGHLALRVNRGQQLLGLPPELPRLPTRGAIEFRALARLLLYDVLAAGRPPKGLLRFIFLP
jgi:hypothetical protein